MGSTVLGGMKGVIFDRMFREDLIEVIFEQRPEGIEEKETTNANAQRQQPELLFLLGFIHKAMSSPFRKENRHVPFIILSIFT